MASKLWSVVDLFSTLLRRKEKKIYNILWCMCTPQFTMGKYIFIVFYSLSTAILRFFFMCSRPFLLTCDFFPPLIPVKFSEPHTMSMDILKWGAAIESNHSLEHTLVSIDARQWLCMSLHFFSSHIQSYLPGRVSYGMDRIVFALLSIIVC